MKAQSKIERSKANIKSISLGRYSLVRLKDLKGTFCCIGDVRGAGLFFGVEFIHDGETKEPNSILAQKVVNYMFDEGVLVNRSEIIYNTLKIRPNLPFPIEHADM